MSEDAGAPERRLGEGELPQELDRVNYGAFLLAVLWAPWHGLWGWFGLFVAMEVLESIIGLTGLRFLGGPLARSVAMNAFRLAYWWVTVAFALRANRLVWERRRAAVAAGAGRGRRPPALVSRYLSNQRIWTVVGLVGLAATPLSLLVPSLASSPDAVTDVVVTGGVQVALLVALFVHDRLLAARRRKDVP